MDIWVNGKFLSKYCWLHLLGVIQQPKQRPVMGWRAHLVRATH